MKPALIAALVAGQLAGAPAFAADLSIAQEQRTGAFAGFRLRVPLDGPARERQARLGLTVAPTLHSLRPGGEIRTRFGEGIELGFGSRGPLALSLAGRRIDRLGIRPDGAAPGGPRAGVSDLGWIAISVGAVVVVVAALAFACTEDSDCT
jgi:hypothetical protein